MRDSDAETRALILNVFVPGLGHLQAGDTGPGVALLGLGVALPVGTALATGVSSFQCSSGAGCDDLDSNTALFLTAATVGLGAWIYGMVDADNADAGKPPKKPTKARSRPRGRRAGRRAGQSEVRGGEVKRWHGRPVRARREWPQLVVVGPQMWHARCAQQGLVAVRFDLSSH